MKRLVALVWLLNTSLFLIIATLAFVGCTPALHHAVKTGDADRVRQLLDAGADVNVREPYRERLQWTPLHWAAFRGDKGIAALLISRGAELDAEDPYYSTPLYLAAERGHPEIVRQLIAEGAEVNVKSSRLGYTPLHRAAWGPVVLRKGRQDVDSSSELAARYKEIVDVLIAKGAEINARDNDGKTALDEALGSGRDETAALLSQHGGKTGEELEMEEPASSFKDYFVGSVKVRVHKAAFSEDRKRVPWTGYGVDGGFPGTVVTAVEITNASGTYDLPADMVDDLGNPNGHGHVRLIGSLTATRAEERLEFSMSNSDGAGGYEVLFQVDLAKAQARRFVEMAIDDNPTKTHDWTAIMKRKETRRKAEPKK